MMRHREMRLGVYAVVDRMTFLGAKPRVVLHDRCATSIGEYQIVLRYEVTEWISCITLYSLQRGRCIYIPKRHASARGLKVQHEFFEILILFAHATVLDH